MRRRYAVLLIFLTMPWLLTVSAQPGELAFRSHAEHRFGEALRFHLTLEDPPDVQRVQLFFRPHKGTAVYALDVPFTLGTTLTVMREVDLTTVDLAPYQPVTYWWELESDEGRLRISEQTLAYEDDRFQWQQMARDGVTVHWTGQGPFFGQMILDTVSSALVDLAGILPLEAVAPLEVYVYPSNADLGAALRLVGATGAPGSSPELDTLLTAADSATGTDDLARAIPRELTYLLLYRLTGEGYADLPLWLRHGLATVVQGELTSQQAQLLETAVVTRTTIPLAQLCRVFPEDHTERHALALAQSAAFMRYVQLRYGKETIATLLENYATGADCQMGTQTAVGRTLDELDVEWQATLRPRPPVEQFLVDNALWLLLLAGGFGLTLALLWRQSQAT